MSQEVPIADAIAEAHKQAQALGIPKRALPSICTCVVCHCGYRGLGVVDWPAHLGHLLWLLLGSLGLLVLLHDYADRCYCPRCGEGYPVAGTPLPSVPRESIAEAVNGLKNRVDSHSSLHVRGCLVVLGALIAILFLALVLTLLFWY